MFVGAVHGMAHVLISFVFIFILHPRFGYLPVCMRIKTINSQVVL